MKKDENVRKNISIGLQQEFNSAVSRALKPILEKMTPGDARGWIKYSKSLEIALSSVLLPPQ